MWTALAIILPPVINPFPGVNIIAELVFVQAFISESSVKILDRSVLGRLVWLDKPQLHAMLKGRLLQCAAGKFRPQISSYRRRIVTKQRDAVQNTRDLPPEIPNAAVIVIVRYSFVKSSMQVRHFIMRAGASASITKSIDQVHTSTPRLPASGLSSVLSSESRLKRLLIEHGFGEQLPESGVLLFR